MKDPQNPARFGRAAHVQAAMDRGRGRAPAAQPRAPAALPPGRGTAPHVQAAIQAAAGPPGVVAPRAATEARAPAPPPVQPRAAAPHVAAAIARPFLAAAPHPAGMPPAQARIQPAVSRAQPAVGTGVPGRSPAPAVLRPSPPPSASGGAGTAVQPYQVLSGESLYDREPTKRPWFGYPYAVVGSGRFDAQAIKRNVGGVHEFLARDRGKEEPHIKQHGTTGLRLRVSDDNRLAIEDSDLSRRQPKIFYATSDIIRASNRALKGVGSYFQLIQGGERVKILTGWWSAETLYSVYLRYNAPTQKNKRKWKKATSSSAYQHIRPPQNCNAIAAEVIGGSSSFLGTNTLSHAIRKAGLLAPTEEEDRQRVFRDSRYSSEQYFQYEDRAIRAYLTHSDGDEAERQGLNRFAAPEVGEGFVVATLGRAIRQQNGRGVYRDFDTDTERELNWSYHFGGVVARSGNDRVTLENYARGDGRADSPDPRWYFQMYGTGGGQSYYEVYRATTDYANPIVFTVKK